MLNDNVKKLCAVLRSEKYPQCTGKLSDGIRYCIMGAACEVFNEENPGVLEIVVGETSKSYNGCLYDLPPIVQNWFGFRTSVGDYEKDGLHECLTADNDEGVPFPEIADIIESEPEGLFLDSIEKGDEI